MLSRTLPDIPKTDPRESEYLWDTATAHTWHHPAYSGRRARWSDRRTRPSGKALRGVGVPLFAAAENLYRVLGDCTDVGGRSARDQTLPPALHTSWSLPPQSSAILRQERSCERRSCSAYIRKLIDTENLSPRRRRGLEKKRNSVAHCSLGLVVRGEGAA
jgi:hypothetical protein